MSKKALWIVVAIVVIAAIVIGVRMSQKPAAPGEVTIGAVLPMTGSLAFFGGPEKDALTMAVDEANARGGVDGRKVGLSFEDSKASAKDGVSALQKLLLEKPLAVITSLTIVSNATLPILRDAKVPQIALSVHPTLVEQSDYIVRPYYGFEEEVRVFADYVTGKGYKRVAALWVMVPECESAVKEVLIPAMRRVGGSVVASESYNLGESSARAQLTKIAAAKPDVVLVLDFGTMIGPILKDGEALGIRGKLVPGIGMLTSPPIDKSLLEGVRFLGPSFIISREKKYEDFARAFKARTGKDAGYDVVYTYDAFNLLLEGIRRARGNQSEIVREIRGMGEYDGVGGKMTILPNGNVTVAIGLGIFSNGQMKPYRE
jgi:branched-chain amino acid transport system substrate-binding protein